MVEVKLTFVGELTGAGCTLVWAAMTRMAGAWTGGGA